MHDAQHIIPTYPVGVYIPILPTALARSGGCPGYIGTCNYEKYANITFIKGSHLRIITSYLTDYPNQYTANIPTADTPTYLQMSYTLILTSSCPICGRDNSERPFLVIFFIVLLLSRNCFTVPPVLLLDRRAFLNNHLRINVNIHVYVSHSYPHTTEYHCFPQLSNTGMILVHYNMY